MRVSVQIMLADFRQRRREASFLMSLGVLLGLCLIYLPGRSAGYTVMDIAGYRGMYNSAWIGTLSALLSSIILSLLGFYLVKNGIERDRSTGVAQLIAASPVGKLNYVLGKFMSNVMVFLTFLSAIALTGAALQLVRGEDMLLKPLELLTPLLYIALPALIWAAAAAVFFESVSWLRGGFGNLAYFLLWTVMLGLGATGGGPGFDLTGASVVFYSLSQAAKGLPGLATQSLTLRLLPVPTGRALHSELFDWSGIAWTPEIVMSRMFWLVPALLLVAAAACSLQLAVRSTNVALHRRISARSTNSKSRTRGLSYSSLPVASRSSGFVGLIVGELKMMLKGKALAWYALLVGLAIAGLVVPEDVGRQWLLPFSWLLPLTAWSELGCRARIYSVQELLRTAPGGAMVSILSQWLAGSLVALLASGGIMARTLATDAPQFAALLSAAGFIPALALFMGSLSGGRRMFEAAYSALWYAGAINRFVPLDFIGVTDAAMQQGVPLFFLGVAVLLLLGSLGLKRWHASTL